MAESVMRKRAKKRLSLEDRQDVLSAEIDVATHEEYKPNSQKVKKKPRQYERQGVKYDLYFDSSPKKLMRKRNSK